MRWMLLLIMPLAILLLGPASGSAQEIPVTVTLQTGNNAVTAVEFPDIAPGRRFLRPPNGAKQYLVGFLAPDGQGDYRTTVVYYTGGEGAHTAVIQFDREASCQEPGVTEGVIQRIACAVVDRGAALTCAAIYSGMNSPPAECTGTYRCVRCPPSGTKMCGANPVCAG